jgi:membrane-bound lytic murein transglycosylase A
LDLLAPAAFKRSELDIGRNGRRLKLGALLRDARAKRIGILLISSVAFAAIAAALLLFGVIRFPQRSVDLKKYEYVGASWTKLSFEQIEGWRRDDTAQSIDPFLRTCDRLLQMPADAPANADEALGADAPPGVSLAGRAGDWREPCAAARQVTRQRFIDASAHNSAARSLFESHFTPLRLADVYRRKNPLRALGDARRMETGLFTAYFEPVYEATAFSVGAFSAPVLARPADLVSVDLGDFSSDFAGNRIAGRIADAQLIPYEDHAAIAAGALGAHAAPIAYMRPNELFFLQIQGSGRLRIDGVELRVGYDGQNGHPYTAIGKVLIDEGVLKREEVSMQTIKAWLDRAPPEEAARVRHMNKSYVFFRQLPDTVDPMLGPIGSASTPLSAGRSLAVDARFVGLGAPVFVSIPGDKDAGTEEFRRLMIAQDTGGAIKGAVRGDIFMGSGDDAGEKAGAFKAQGSLIVLVPNRVAARLAIQGER